MIKAGIGGVRVMPLRMKEINEELGCLGTARQKVGFLYFTLAHPGRVHPEDVGQAKLLLNKLYPEAIHEAVQRGEHEVVADLYTKQGRPGRQAWLR